MARIPERVLDLTHTLTAEFPLYPEVVVVDVRDRVVNDDDALVVPDDVLAWESAHGPFCPIDARCSR